MPFTNLRQVIKKRSYKKQHQNNNNNNRNGAELKNKINKNCKLKKEAAWRVNFGSSTIIIFKYLCPRYTFLNDRSRKWTTNRKTGKKGTQDICRPTGNKLLWGKKIDNESDIIFYQHLMRGPAEIHTNSFPADSRPNRNLKLIIISFLKERRNLRDHWKREKWKSDYVWGITGSTSTRHTHDIYADGNPPAYNSHIDILCFSAEFTLQEKHKHFLNCQSFTFL